MQTIVFLEDYSVISSTDICGVPSGAQTVLYLQRKQRQPNKQHGIVEAEKK